MNIWMTVLLFLVGLLLIVKGGDWFLDGAVWIAEATGVPRFIIGATIVSLATTLPELTVSVTGVLQGEVDLAVGNAVGSVTANLGLILGISVVCLPSVVSKRQFNMKAVLMVTGAALLVVLPFVMDITFLLAQGDQVHDLTYFSVWLVWLLYLLVTFHVPSQKRRWPKVVCVCLVSLILFFVILYYVARFYGLLLS